MTGPSDTGCAGGGGGTLMAFVFLVVYFAGFLAL